MRRYVTVAAVVGLLVVGLVPHAAAITGNYVRDFEHTGVGLLVTYDEDGAFSGRCSGTLLTPTVFLTAAHCTYGQDSGRVYFEQAAGAALDPGTGIDATTGYPMTGGIEAARLITADEYDDYATFPNTWDLAVVILAEPYTIGEDGEPVEYAALLAPDVLEGLAARGGKRHVSFTVSGYGLSWINPAQQISLRERLMATASLTNLRSSLADGYNLAHSGDPGRGKGGTCFGDSGGPVFLDGIGDGTPVIAAVTSFGLSSKTCTGPGFAYRVDQEPVIEWLEDLVPEGETLRVVGD
jgi:hypothetical protein